MKLLGNQRGYLDPDPRLVFFGFLLSGIGLISLLIYIAEIKKRTGIVKWLNEKIMSTNEVIHIDIDFVALYGNMFNSWIFWTTVGLFGTTIIITIIFPDFFTKNDKEKTHGIKKIDISGH